MSVGLGLGLFFVHYLGLAFMFFSGLAQHPTHKSMFHLPPKSFRTSGEPANPG